MGKLAQTETALYPVFNRNDRLRKAREQAGLDQSELAVLLGCDRGTISNAERGKHEPNESTLRLWSLATGVSLHWLKTGEQLPDDGPLAQLVELRTFNP